MQYFLRFLALVVYYVGSCLQFIIKYSNGIKRQRIPEFDSDIFKHSATELVRKLRMKELTSEELVRAYIKRIKAVNPVLNAVVEDRFVAAIEDAKTVDEAIGEATDSWELFENYPLLGVPFTVKECCAIKGLSHVVGSPFRSGVKSSEDGAAVALLRKAGAIPLLVSANPELCVSWETSTLTSGRCTNPYNTEYTPGGSSGGEAALNGAGATVFGIGSDFCGSIRIPAMFTGVYGHKPSGELVSPKGHFPQTQTQVGMEKCLQMGPITRFPEDLPLLLNVIAGKNVSKLVDGVNIDKMKIFYVDLSVKTTVVPIWGSIKDTIGNACHHFKLIGNHVEELKLDEMNDMMEITIARNMKFKPPQILNITDNPKDKTTVFAEFKKHFKGTPLHTISTLYFLALYDFGNTFPAFKTDHYQKRMESLESKLSETLGNDGVLFLPTFHRPAFLHNTSIIHTAGTPLTGLFNVLGLPSLNVPMGLDESGLPIGFQVIAGPYADRNCFKVAAELDKVFGGWVSPTADS